MNVNMKGAAQNAYDGIKAVLDFIEEDSDNYDNMNDFIYDLNEIIVKYQPQLAAYLLLEHFSQEAKSNQ